MLKFGTGGIRAIMGPDEGLMNMETVTKDNLDTIKKKKLPPRLKLCQKQIKVLKPI